MGTHRAYSQLWEMLRENPWPLGLEVAPSEVCEQTKITNS